MKKKILILSANPINTSKLRLDEEVREIQSALERSRRREEFEVIPRLAVRIDDLRRALLDNNPEIVHFSGHGDGTDGIALENGSGHAQLVSTESLSNLFKLFKETVECVLFNACYSQVQANAISQHINCVIGMERTITNKAAIHFSTAFYDGLGVGRSYKDAFDFGCNNIDLNSIPESLTPKIKIINNSKTLFPNNQANNQPKEQKEVGAMTNNTGGISQNVSGSSVYGGIQAAQGNNNQQISNTYASQEQKQTLAEAAAEIQQLLEQLSQSYPTNTMSGKMALAAEATQRIENNPTLMQKTISALKAGGTAALEQLLSHPAASFVIAALEDWHKNHQ